MSSPQRTVEGLIAVYEASREAFVGRSALNLPALNVTVQQMLDALEQVAGPAVRARVRFERDERIAGIVANWPRGATAARAGAARAAAGARLRGHHPPVHRRLRGDRRRSAERTARMNQIDLEGRVAVVTGGAQGIGYAIAERLLALGRRGRAVGRRRARWPRRPRALGAHGSVAAKCVELTDDAAVAAAAEAAVDAHGAHRHPRQQRRHHRRQRHDLGTRSRRLAPGASRST